MDLLAIHLQMKEWILMAGELIRTEVEKGITVSEKTSRKDLVTNLDRAVENFLISRIQNRFPEHQIISEEGFGDQVTDLVGYTWFIDPIDGTLNFVHQKRNFAIMVALFENGKPALGYIYDVMRKEFTYSIAGYGAYQNELRLPPVAEKAVEDGLLHMNGSMILNATPAMKSIIDQSLGTRTIGAAALNHVAVIRGDAVAYVSMMLAPWDIAAGLAIAQEVGVEVCDMNGQPIDLLKPKHEILVVNKGAKAQMLAVCQSLAKHASSFK